MRSEAGERKRARPHHSDSLWSHRHFHLLPAAPQSAPLAQPRMCPPPHTLSTAYWHRVTFLDAMTPLRDPVVRWLQPPPSSPLPQTPTVARWGSRAPLLPLSPEGAEQRSTLEPCKPRPHLPPPSTCLIRVLPFNRLLFSVHTGQGPGCPQLPGGWATPPPPPWPGEAPVPRGSAWNQWRAAFTLRLTSSG